MNEAMSAEDYATVDQLSGGRLELMIGKGDDPRHFPLFGLSETCWGCSRRR